MAETFAVALAGLGILRDPNVHIPYAKDAEFIIDGTVKKRAGLLPSEVADNMRSGRTDHAYIVRSLCGLVINSAFESVKDRNDRTPVFEFFRHIRNAGSHGNKFFFIDSQPSRPAAWRGLTMDERLKGTANPLFGTQCFGTFLDVADVWLVLHDLEQLVK